MTQATSISLLLIDHFRPFWFTFTKAVWIMFSLQNSSESWRVLYKLPSEVYPNNPIFWMPPYFSTQIQPPPLLIYGQYFDVLRFTSWHRDTIYTTATWRGNPCFRYSAVTYRSLWARDSTLVFHKLRGLKNLIYTNVIRPVVASVDDYSLFLWYRELMGCRVQFSARSVSALQR